MKQIAVLFVGFWLQIDGCGSWTKAKKPRIEKNNTNEKKKHQELEFSDMSGIHTCFLHIALLPELVLLHWLQIKADAALGFVHFPPLDAPKTDVSIHTTVEARVASANV